MRSLDINELGGDRAWSLQKAIRSKISTARTNGDITFRVQTRLVEQFTKTEPKRLTGKSVLLVYNPDDPRVLEAMKKARAKG